MMRFDIPKELVSIIKVIGVGGGGGNAVNHMFRLGIKGVDFIVCNTDIKALEGSPVPIKVQLGKALTQGLGAGSLPEVGMKSAIESLDQIKDFLSKGTKMVFITAGMGGGTGTGGAPIIAQTAREMGVLTVAIATLPFSFEGKNKRKQAELGIEELKKHVDCLLVITNDKLREIYGNLGVRESFAQADNVLANAAKSIAELISHTKHMNVDFNDVHTAMKNSGVALMGTGSASGENRAIRAVEVAMNSPLLNDNEITGAKFVLIDITSGTQELTMDELGEITDFIQDSTGTNADIKIGYGVDESLGDAVNVTIIATGFHSRPLLGYETPKKPEKKVHSLDDKPAANLTAPPVSEVSDEPVLKGTTEVTSDLKTDENKTFSNMSREEKDRLLEPVLVIKNVEEVAPEPEVENDSDLFSSDFLSAPVEESTPEVQSWVNVAPLVEETVSAEPEAIVEPVAEEAPVVMEAPVAQEEPMVQEEPVVMEEVKEEVVMETEPEPEPEILFETETYIADEAPVVEEAPVAEETINPEPELFTEEPEIVMEEDTPVMVEPDAFVVESEAEVKEVEITLDFTAEEVSVEPVMEQPMEPVAMEPVSELTPEETPVAEVTPVADETPMVEMRTEDIQPQVLSFEQKKQDEIVAEEKSEETMASNSQIRKAQERIQRLKELSYKLKSPNGLAELENEPAYKRKGINLDNQQHSSESNVSRYTLSEGEDKKIEIKPNNSFLHDNVD